MQTLLLDFLVIICESHGCEALNLPLYICLLSDCDFYIGLCFKLIRLLVDILCECLIFFVSYVKKILKVLCFIH